MAPFGSETPPFSLPARNETVLVMQDPNSPWAMDLNTSVTIIFGILGLIFQAGQICYGRRQITRMPLQNNVVQSTETAFKIPDATMPQRGRTAPSRRGRGSPRSVHQQQRPPFVEALPTGHARQPNRMVDRCTLPPPQDVIRRRSSSHYSNRGRWGSASGFTDRSRYLSQYNDNQNPQYVVQGYEVQRVC